MNENTKTGWEDLANAVILQAAEDYREVCRGLRKHPRSRRPLEQKRSLEYFFRSGWFKVLSAVDGRKLLEQIRKEISV